MKKLLTIFSSFGIIMSSTLSIISCEKTYEQKPNITLSPDKKRANDAVHKLISKLMNATFDISDLGTTDKAKALNDKLLADDRVKSIITGDVVLEGGKFTLQVGNNEADDANIVDNNERSSDSSNIVTCCRITVFAVVRVNAETDRFIFSVLLQNNQKWADDAANELCNLKRWSGNTFNISEIDTTNKTNSLNKKLVENSSIKRMLTGYDATIEGEKFTFKIGNAVAKETDIKAGATITVTGKTKSGQKYSNTEFSFVIHLSYN